jgi:ATP-binding cassette subfamily F protein 2
MDLYHLHQEAEPSDRTALQAVVDHIEAEVARLNALEEHIMTEFGPEDERLQVWLFSTPPCSCEAVDLTFHL